MKRIYQIVIILISLLSLAASGNAQELDAIPSDAILIYQSTLYDWTPKNKWMASDKTYREISTYSYNSYGIYVLSSGTVNSFKANKKYVIKFSIKTENNGDVNRYEIIELLLSPSVPYYSTNANAEMSNLGTENSQMLLKNRKFQNLEYTDYIFEFTPSKNYVDYYILIGARYSNNAWKTYLKDFELYDCGKVDMDVYSHAYMLSSDSGPDWNNALQDEDALIYDLTELSNTKNISISVSNSNAFVVVRTDQSILASEKSPHNIVLKDSYTDSYTLNNKDGYYTIQDAAGPVPLEYNIWGNVKYTRDNNNDYTMAILPFSAHNTSEHNVYTLNSITDGTLTFEKVTAADIPAYTPILISTKDVNEKNLAFEGANITKSPQKDKFHITKFDELNGWYYGYTTLTTEVTFTDYPDVFSGKSVYGFAGGKFVKATEGMTVKPFRTFLLHDDGVVPQQVSMFSVALQDTPTEIIEIGSELDSKSMETPAYDLNGQRVGEDYEGIVVRNGKKTLKR